MKVLFIVTGLADLSKSKSSLERGKEYIGTLREFNNSVWWKDPINGEDWVFWVNHTCKIIKYINN